MIVDSFKKVSKQTAWQLVGKAVTSLSTLLILSLVSRHYGPSGTGIFTLALTYLAFFYLAADFGLNAYILPELLEVNRETVWRKLFGMRFLLSLLLVLLSLLILPLVPFHGELFNKAILFGCLAIIGNGIFTTSNAIFQSKFRYDLSIIASSVDAIPTVIFIFLLVSLNVSVPTLLIVHMLGWILTGLITLIFVRKYISQLSPIFDFSFMGKTLKESWPISLTLVLNVVYFRVDSFILASGKNFADVGTYNIAYAVFQSALVLPTFIMNGFYPLMLQQLMESSVLFLSNLKKAVLIMFSIALLGTALTYLLAPFVIPVITGNKGFFGSTHSLQILGLSFPAYFISAVLMWTFVSLKKYKSMLVIYVIGLLVNTILNLIFIPKYSYIASSYITGISEYLILILQILILTPTLRRLSK